MEAAVQKLTNNTEVLEKVKQNEEKLDWIITDTCQCNPVGSASLICDVFTKQCQCLPGFDGQRCTQCQENHYGDPNVDCLPCNCNLDGSFSAQCNNQTGQCHCLPNVSGKYCDTFGELLSTYKQRNVLL